MSDRSVARDPWVLGALAVGLVLRALPMLLWGWAGDDCTRDECIFKIAARPILTGEGLGLAPAGWLPAPGFPYLLAACQAIFGSFEAVKWVHWALTIPTIFSLAAIADRLSGVRAARWVAWLFALHPTFIFYVGTMWTEIVYTALLTASVHATLWAREGGPRRALPLGVLLGACVLNRGIATWIAPILALGLLAPDRVTDIAAWPAAVSGRARHLGAYVLALVLTVAPYSISASARWGGLVISDATLGHVIALGNDSYPPITFDYGIGQLTGRLFTHTLSGGRRDCNKSDGPVTYDRCEVKRATAWIAAHPDEFLRRVPTRLAQLLNPHSFLTRHVLWGYWPGLPWALKQLIVVAQVACTALTCGFGTFALVGRARGPIGLISAGVLAYYVVLIGALYGLTRFRLPVEPLLLLWVATWFASPAAAWDELRASPLRLGAATFGASLVAGLMSVYLWTGFPGFEAPLAF